MGKQHKLSTKKNRILKLVGDIIYLDFDEVKQFKYDEITIEDYNSQQLENGVVTPMNDEGINKVIFDVLSSSDYYGGYVKGFFYPDGKFMGHFHYTTDANLPKETVDGLYQKIIGGYEIKGLFYAAGKKQVDFYARLMHQK